MAPSAPALSLAAILAGLASSAAADPTVVVDTVDGNISQSPTAFPNDFDFTIFNGELLSGSPLIVGDVATGVVDDETNGWFTDANNNIDLVDGIATGPSYIGPADGPSAIIGNQAGSDGMVDLGIHDGNPDYQNINGLGLWTSVGDVDIAAEPASSGVVYIDVGGLSILDGDINVGGTSSASGGTATLTLASGLAGINTYFDDNQFTGQGTNLRVWPGGTVNLQGGSINVGGLVDAGGRFDWTRGTLHILDSNFDIGSPGDFFGAGFALNSGMNLQVDQQLSINSVTLNLSGGSLDAGTLVQANGALINFTNGKLTVENGGISTSQIINNQGFLAADGPAADLNGHNFVLNAGQTLNLNNGGALTIEPGDTFTVNGGALTAASIANTTTGFTFFSGSVDLTDPGFGVMIDSVDGNLFGTEDLTLNQNESLALAGSLTVGDVSTASLVIDTTAVNSGVSSSGLTTGGAIVGNQAGSNGSVIIGDSGAGLQGVWVVNGEADIAANPGSTGAVTVTDGTWTVNGNLYVGGSSAGAGGAGTLMVDNHGQLDVTGALTVGNNGKVNLNVANTSLNALNIVGSGVVNLNGSMSINYGSPAGDPINTIVAYLKSGYNNDTWTGPGIDSSDAAANPNLYAVGYADGNTDAGTPAQGNQIVVELTIAGDANLDGTVNFADLLVIAQNFNHTLDTRHNPIDWADGDFNYDGKVNFADLLLVAQNFNKRLSAGQLAQLPGSFAGAWDLALADVQAAQSDNVPEPAAAGLLAVAAAGLLRRRRRDRRLA
ncbi:MAG: dockerin type I domain-containing protein [Tepidisphaeraceae bacterium]|jgi:MYXO-CTERM domain-containing protein